MPAGRGPTPAGAKAVQRTPAPRHEMDELEEEAAAEQAAVPPPKSKTPIIAGAAAAAVLIGALVVWGVLRSPAPAPKPQPVAQAAPARVEQPAPAPVAQPPAAAAVAQQPAPIATPEPIPPPPIPAAVVQAEPPPPARETRPQKPVHRQPAHPASVGASKGVRFVKSELNAIPTPPAASGDGVLAVVATPWAEVFVDGKDIGETPREIQLGAGSYKVKATHPALGSREQVVTIKPGKRQLWAPTFAN
jgi:hypothetical protein